MKFKIPIIQISIISLSSAEIFLAYHDGLVLLFIDKNWDELMVLIWHQEKGINLNIPWIKNIVDACNIKA